MHALGYAIELMTNVACSGVTMDVVRGSAFWGWSGPVVGFPGLGLHPADQVEIRGIWVLDWSAAV